MCVGLNACSAKSWNNYEQQQSGSVNVIGTKYMRWFLKEDNYSLNILHSTNTQENIIKTEQRISYLRKFNKAKDSES
jgi:hypothetical protein